MGSTVYYAGIAEYVVRASKGYGKGHGHHRGSSKSDRHGHYRTPSSAKVSVSYVPPPPANTLKTGSSNLYSQDDMWQQNLRGSSTLAVSQASSARASPRQPLPSQPLVVTTASSPLGSSALGGLYPPAGSPCQSPRPAGVNNVMGVPSVGASEGAFSASMARPSASKHGEPVSCSAPPQWRSFANDAADASCGKQGLWNMQGSYEKCSKPSSGTVVFYLPSHSDSTPKLSATPSSFYAVFYPNSVSANPVVLVGQREQKSCGETRCFRDDDTVFPEQLVEQIDNLNASMARTNLEIAYSPWAMQMMDGLSLPEKAVLKENSGGGNGGKGPRGGDGDGDGGDEGEEDEDSEHVYLLPALTLAFAALHLGYCIATWVKEDGFDQSFARTALGLLSLLAVSIIRMRYGTGIDAYILGLGASVGVMFWAAERSVAKRQVTPGGILALFGAAMSFVFTAALYQFV